MSVFKADTVRVVKRWMHGDSDHVVTFAVKATRSRPCKAFEGHVLESDTFLLGLVLVSDMEHWIYFNYFIPLHAHSKKLYVFRALNV